MKPITRRQKTGRPVPVQPYTRWARTLNRPAGHDVRFERQFEGYNVIAETAMSNGGHRRSATLITAASLDEQTRSQAQAVAIAYARKVLLDLHRVTADAVAAPTTGGI